MLWSVGPRNAQTSQRPCQSILGESMAHQKSSKFIRILVFVAIQLIMWPLIAVLWGLTTWRDPIALLQAAVDIGFTVLCVAVSVCAWKKEVGAE